MVCRASPLADKMAYFFRALARHYARDPKPNSYRIPSSGGRRPFQFLLGSLRRQVCRHIKIIRAALSINYTQA